MASAENFWLPFATSAEAARAQEGAPLGKAAQGKAAQGKAAQGKAAQGHTAQARTTRPRHAESCSVGSKATIWGNSALEQAPAQALDSRKESAVAGQYVAGQYVADQYVAGQYVAGQYVADPCSGVSCGLGGDMGGAQGERRRVPIDLPIERPEFNAHDFGAAPRNEHSRVERAGLPGVGRNRRESVWPASMGLLRNSALETGRASSAPSWGWREVAGRLCELAGGPASATLSCAASLVLDAQLRGENVAWIQTRDSSFLPQDLDACGIDLDALVVVRLPRSTDLGLAAEWIARSGAFGLVVVDLTSAVHTPMAMQARLLALAKKHDLALVCLTEKNPQQASLSSLVSLRVDTTVRRPARARSTPRLAQAELQETGGAIAPTLAQAQAATPERRAGAFETNDVESPRQVASSMHSSDLGERERHGFDCELSGTRSVESESAPTGTEAASPAAPQATGHVVKDPAQAASCQWRNLATFECEWWVAKDKRRSRPWRHIEARRGPPGLR